MLCRHICATVLQLIEDLFKPFLRTKEDIISFQLRYVVKNIFDFVDVLPNIASIFLKVCCVDIFVLLSYS